MKRALMTAQHSALGPEVLMTAAPCIPNKALALQLPLYTQTKAASEWTGSNWAGPRPHKKVVAASVISKSISKGCGCPNLLVVPSAATMTVAVTVTGVWEEIERSDDMFAKLCCLSMRQPGLLHLGVMFI